MFTKIFKEIPSYIVGDDGREHFVFKLADGSKYAVHFAKYGWDVETLAGEYIKGDAVSSLIIKLSLEIDNYSESIRGLRANLSGISTDIDTMVNSISYLDPGIVHNMEWKYKVIQRRSDVFNSVLKTLVTRERKLCELEEVFNEFRAAKRRTLISVGKEVQCKPDWESEKKEDRVDRIKEAKRVDDISQLIKSYHNAKRSRLERMYDEEPEEMNDSKYIHVTVRFNDGEDSDLFTLLHDILKEAEGGSDEDQSSSHE